MNNDKSKKYFWIFLDVLIAGLVINLLFFVMPLLSDISDSRYPVRTINVNAEGRTTIKPDLAQFSFSVITEGANLDQVAKENNEQLRGAIDFVKSQGIPEEDIKTTQYNLNPKYEYDEVRQRSFVVGYELTQTVLVKVKKLDENLGKVSTILGSLPELGVNQISGVSFTVEEPEKFLAEAREEAFEKAKEKAKAMADANGVKLGRVISFNDYSGGPIYPFYDKALGRGGDFAGIEALPPSPIQPGTEEIVVNVNVTYEIK